MVIKTKQSMPIGRQAKPQKIFTRQRVRPQAKSCGSKLRFPGFFSEWEEKRLGDFFDITSSKRVFQDEWTTSGVPFYRAREIVKLSDDGYVNNELYISNEMFGKYSKKYGAPKESDILVTGVGTIGRVYVVKKRDKFYFKDGNIVWFRNLDLSDSQFIKHLFYTRNIKKQISDNAAGSTIGTYTIDFAKKTKVKIPSFPEQQKIAEFLGAVNGWIENLRMQKENFESYKKGMMQKIFVQEIRFKDNKGKNFPKWQEKRLGEVLDYEQPTSYIVKNTEYSDEYKIPVLTAGKTFILGYTNEQKGIFEAKKLPVIIFDDFTTAQKFVNFSFKVKSSAMKILKNKDDNVSDIGFIFLAMQRIRFGLGEEHKRFWISEYSKIKIPFPIYKEQQKIADFLTSIDNLIESKQQQITQAEQWKKGLMQGLFV